MNEHKSGLFCMGLSSVALLRGQPRFGVTAAYGTRRVRMLFELLAYKRHRRKSLVQLRRAVHFRIFYKTHLCMCVSNPVHLY
jgi:hypothetical protein